MIITAKDRVLRNPELVETILSHTSNWTVLHAQRVSRAWRLIVQSSIPLQQELFFRPKPTPTHEDGYPVWQFNPLLFVAFPSWFIQPRHRYNMPSLKAFEDMEWDKTEKRLAAYTREEASWRRMLPIQPPIELLEIKNFSHGKKIDGLSNDVAYFPDGLRMGVLYDLTEAHIARHRVSSFAVIWPSNHFDILVGYIGVVAKEEDIQNGEKDVKVEEDEKPKEETNGEKEKQQEETNGEKKKPQEETAGEDEKPQEGTNGKDEKPEHMSPPPPPSPPPRPAPIRVRADDGSSVAAGPPSAAMPSPWVIGSLVSTKITDEEAPVEEDDDSDAYDEEDSLCGENNYGRHVTLVLANVEQCYPGSLPTRRPYKSEGQESVAVQMGRYRFRRHGGPWEDLDTFVSYPSKQTRKEAS